MVDEEPPLLRAGRTAFLAMIVVGTLVLIALAGMARESGSEVALELWVVVLGYACASLFGWSLAPRAARALASGDSVMLGPLLGIAMFLIAGSIACVFHALTAEPIDSAETFWDRFIDPFAAWLLVGALPSMLVGGVFSAALTVVLPRKPLKPRRPPGV